MVHGTPPCVGTLNPVCDPRRHGLSSSRTNRHEPHLELVLAIVELADSGLPGRGEPRDVLSTISPLSRTLALCANCTSANSPKTHPPGARVKAQLIEAQVFARRVSLRAKWRMSCNVRWEFWVPAGGRGWKSPPQANRFQLDGWQSPEFRRLAAGKESDPWRLDELQEENWFGRFWWSASRLV
jgi:hypothetical protein